MDDAETAADNYAMIQAFMVRFPEVTEQIRPAQHPMF